MEQEEELQSIMELDKQNEMSYGGQMQELTSAAFLRPFKCVGVIYLLYALSGVHIIHTYTLTFLEVNLILYSEPELQSKVIVFPQEASGQNMNFLSPHDAAIALGTFKLAASVATDIRSKRACVAA